VRIQCERCSTTYELDDSRLPPSGASVQCTRCQHVFRAFPAGAADKTWLGHPPPAPPFDPAVPRPRGEAAPAARVRAEAPVTPSEARARPVTPPPAVPGRDPRGDTTVSRLATRLRARRKRAWMLPAAALLAAAAAGATWLVLRSRVDPAALALRAEAQALLLRDDRASLDAAVSKLAASATADPGYSAARADEALALLLLSDDAAEEARPPEDRFRALDAERVREESERSPGWEARQAQVVSRMRAAQAESQPMRARSRALREEALALLRPLARGRSPEVEVERALALYYALEGEFERAEQAAGRGSDDPWIAFALATAGSRRRGAAPSGEDAVVALERLAAAHPEMLRGRMSLARALVAAGRRDEAVTVLDGILATNVVHERAKALKAQILAPPPVAVTAAPSTAAAPPPRKTGHLPRLRAKP